MASVIYSLFDTLSAEAVPVIPKGGQTYLYTWSDEKKKDDWRADGYRWRQMGTWRKMKCDDGEIEKVWFYVSICIYFSSPSPSLPAPRSPTPPQLEHRNIDQDICHECNAADPPPRKNGRVPTAVHWVGCDRCPRWYHTQCVGLKNAPSTYVCDMCKD